ncbi:MAG: ShlB/FhaC/HecB family hemolysin secretion/activation protein [Rhodospirillales bacterium]|nr:ShlB/FhaC/HecB family hemolysin secretion/activation protein [Rhodospirillales bacterium]MBO6787013.1 ShlB/FhaC/HecB family hemolysin secretion/activation protein [Rhodospirillales bacterium]
MGAILALVFVGAPMPAVAQSTSDPARVEERIDRREQTLPRKGETGQPLQPAPVADDLKSVDEIRFILSAVTFLGNTQFTSAAFTQLYEPYLAREISLEDVKKITDSVTAFYREKGFFLSRAVVESQNLEFGVLNIRVIEGRITEVKFETQSADQKDLLRPYGDKIASIEGPANVNTVERYLLLMNDLPGIDARAKVNRIDEDAGVYGLDIAVKKKAVSAFFNVDNRGSHSVGRDQAYVSATANGWLTGRESTRLGVFTIPSSPNELRYVELAQQWALGAEGTTVSLFGSYSMIDAGAEEEDNDLNSQSSRGSVSVSHPIVRGRAENLKATVSFDASRQKQFDSGVFDFEDRLQVLRGGLDGYYEDELQGANSGNIWISRGLAIDDSDRLAPQRSRSGGRPVFTKVYARAERLQAITDKWSVKLSVAGQASDQRLLSAEEFSLGGYLYGRGYEGGEISGTHGAAGMVELQYGDNIDLGWLSSYQFYGFYDGGVVWETATNSYASEHESLTSAGVGVRAALGENFISGLEVATPLTRPAAEIGGDGKSPRVFMFLSGNF